MTSIALFRGINVGGRSLPMKELVEECESLGLENVRTYIQSGNVVFETSRAPARALAGRLADAVRARRGFRPEILILRADDLAAVVRENPFPKAVSDPKTLHAFFLAKAAAPADLVALEKLRAGRERFELTTRAFYLHAPDGFGTSKLAARVEHHLGVPATARNWRTVMKLAEMSGV
ncbi:MAG: DUF1697 domain-containing protein [bacterium]